MIDQFGLIVETNGDGGDCPCRCGVVIAHRSQTSDPTSLVKATQFKLMPSNGVYYRYPTTYNQTNDFSRDQASRLMLGYGFAGFGSYVSEYYTKLTKNWFRHQNGDFMGTGEPGNIIRSTKSWYLYPLLLLLDVKFLVDIIAYKWQGWDYDNLFIADLYFAKIRYPTPFAFIARKLYNKGLAAERVTKNLDSVNGNNGCAEALEANLWFLTQM